MGQLNTEVKTIINDAEQKGYNLEEIKVMDYDDQPYGDDNILVRSSKRRAFFSNLSEF